MRLRQNLFNLIKKVINKLTTYLSTTNVYKLINGKARKANKMPAAANKFAAAGTLKKIE